MTPIWRHLLTLGLAALIASPLLAQHQREWEYRDCASSDLGSFVITAGMATAGAAAGTLGLVLLMSRQCDGECGPMSHAAAWLSLGLPFVGAATGAVVGRSLTGGRQHFGRSLLGAVVGTAVGGVVVAAAIQVAKPGGLRAEAPYVIFAIPVGAITAWVGWR